MRRAVVAIAALAAARAASAERIHVKVIDVAGDLAYITPGATAGLVPGSKVGFGSITATIVEVTANNASIKLAGFTVAVGQSGSADVASGAARARPSGTPLRATPVTGVWPELITPAQVQKVRRVPLGRVDRGNSHLHATLIGGGYGAVASDSRTGDAEARAIASWDMVADRPFALDVDASARVFSEGYDRRLRVPVFVRSAQLRYGSAADPRFAIGRLRYAATAIGMLDGARGSLRWGALQLGAFGGIVPDPVSGKPDTSASRFGVEAAYDAPTAAWRPRIAAIASGSTWQGKLDERRLVIDVSAANSSTAVFGWAEAQSFVADNPWGARTVELTGAGASAQWHRRGARIGATLDFLRPERSLRLAAVLPPEWLCTPVAVVGDGSGQACRGGDYTVTGTLSAGARFGPLTVDAYGMVGRTHLVETTLDRSGYLRSEFAIAKHRLIAASSAGKAGFVSWNSAEGGVGTHILPPLDFAVRYRADLLDYVSSTGPVLQHSVVVDAWYALRGNLDLTLSAFGTLAPDREALALFTTFVWRALP